MKSLAPRLSKCIKFINPFHPSQLCFHFSTFSLMFFSSVTSLLHLLICILQLHLTRHLSSLHIINLFLLLLFPFHHPSTIPLTFFSLLISLSLFHLLPSHPPTALNISPQFSTPNLSFSFSSFPTFHSSSHHSTLPYLTYSPTELNIPTLPF